MINIKSNISYLFIKYALEFYEVNDKDYMDKCINFVDELNNDVKLKKEFNLVYDMLYGNDKDVIDRLWKKKKMSDLFIDNTNPFITNVLLLCGYKTHELNMNLKEFDNEQIKIHKKRVRECLTKDIYDRHYEGIRISQMVWGTYFTNTRIIEVGRLQYEYVNDRVVKIHIPAGKKLDVSKVKESINNSKKELNKYFELSNYEYHCDSWLLSNEIHNMLDSNSNIYRFYDLFEVEQGEECTSDILNFVFNVTSVNSYEELDESTSLKLKIKNYLLDGNVIKLGHGILK